MADRRPEHEEEERWAEQYDGGLEAAEGDGANPGEAAAATYPMG
jgi:hypothetical protein